MSENTEAQLLDKLQESIFSNAWEKLFDYGMEATKIMDNYKTNLEILGTNLKLLTAKASEVNEQMKNGEQSGKRKKKIKVENWLKEVEKMESELGVLQNEVQEEGFLGRFFGEDRVSELNARVCELVEQSQHFGEVLLKNLTESFFSKVGEKIVNYGLETVTGNKDSKFMLKTLQRSLNSLTDKACDINEQIKHGEQSGTKKRKREVENWLEEVTEIENDLGDWLNEVQEGGFLSRFFSEDRISQLYERVCALVDQSHHFGELLLDTNEMRGEPLLTNRLIGKAFENNIEVIWKLLVNDKVKSIGIYGMGGVGKTTLAKHIKNRLLKETRCSVYWISVSQLFTINKLQGDIAKVIGLDLSVEENEDKRAGRLSQALSIKKDFVIILDNVWSDIDLEKMGDPLGVEGGRLIVTTRLLSVCQRINCQEAIKVETLRTGESWTLFRATLGERTAITSEVEEIAKCLAKECDGLPLGIIILAKLMKGVTDIHEWRNVYDEISKSPMNQGEMEEKLFRVIQFSFNRLNTKLQLCFLYCSLYPEDYQIAKDELIRKFISEELVDKRKSFEKQLDQGKTMLSKLSDLGLLEREYNYGERFQWVKMHDLVRDMALRIARESPKYKVFAGLELKELPNEEEWTEDVDKISLMRNEIRKIPPEMAPNCPKLATLLLNNNPLKSIPESFFSQMSGLYILDLSNTSILELPNSLSDLESLRMLLLMNCRYLVSLPYLGKLKALRELDLSRTAIKEMPKGMKNLINLQILLFGGAKELKLLPEDLSLRSPLLQCLELPFEIVAPVHEIVKFEQMKRFIGRFEDFSDFCLFQSQTGRLIFNFNYVVGSEGDYFFGHFVESFDRNGLRMNKLNFRSGGGEDSVITLPEKIKKLEIQNCKGLSCHLFDDLKSCPSSLEKLIISNCEGIESIWNINDDRLVAEREIKVKYIILENLPDLKGLVNWEVGVGPLPCPPRKTVTLFSSLQSLSIWKCDKMKTLRLPLPFLDNIRIIKVEDCAEIEELIEAAEDDELSELTFSLPILVTLILINLPKLKSICKARIDCKSIQMIDVWGCPRVKKLPLFLPSSSDGQVINYSPPPALKENHIRIEKVLWDSLEWDDPTHKHLLQPLVCRYWR